MRVGQQSLVTHEVIFHQLTRLSLLPQRTTHLHHAGTCLPDRPQHQEELGASQQAGSHRLLLLRCHQEQLSHHQRGWSQGTTPEADVNILGSSLLIRGRTDVFGSGGERMRPDPDALTQMLLLQS